MIATCSYCGTKNRIPALDSVERITRARCGNCKKEFTIAALTSAINEDPRPGHTRPGDDFELEQEDDGDGFEDDEQSDEDIEGSDDED